MIVKSEYPLSELTGKIIGSAMEVHKQLGNGFQEVIYQRVFQIEMTLHNLKFRREQEIKIFYKSQMIGTRKVDFLVEGKIPVEIKAITQLENVHLAQAINYLEAFNLQVGSLINFGNTSLQYKRVMKSNKKNH